MLLVLTGVTAISVALLAYVNELTKEPIAQANAKTLSDAVSAVVPGFDNDPIAEKKTHGRMTVFIQLEQVKLTCRADGERIACAARTAVGLTQQMTAVALERRAVRIANVAVKAHYTALSRPPRQNGKRCRIGKQQQIRRFYIEKAAQRRRVEVDALLESAFQLGRHDGDVLLVAENIAKRKTNELYVVLLNKLYDFAHGGVHRASLLFIMYLEE